MKMWAIMYKKELCMTRLLYGGCKTFNPLSRRLYLVSREVKNLEI